MVEVSLIYNDLNGLFTGLLFSFLCFDYFVSNLDMITTKTI